MSAFAASETDQRKVGISFNHSLSHIIVMRLSMISLVGFSIWSGLTIAQSWDLPGKPYQSQEQASCPKEPIYGGMILVDWKIDPHFVYFAPESVIRPKRRITYLVEAMRASLNTTLTILTNYKAEVKRTTLNNVYNSSCNMELFTATGDVQVSQLWDMLLNSSFESRIFDFNITHRSVEDYVEKLQSLVLPRHVELLVYRPGSNVYRRTEISWTINCPATASAVVKTTEELNCRRCADVKEDLYDICKMPKTFKGLNDMGLKVSSITCWAKRREGEIHKYCLK
jgi:hypothetical protein